MATLLSASGNAYSLGGFQSLSGGQTLSLRGGTAKQPTEYVAPRWSPTIDVLAVPEGRSLRLVRLSGGATIWRRALSDAISGLSTAIRAIAWNLSGTSIAVLHASGLLVQRDSARGDIIHETQVNIDDAVVAMEWVICKGQAADNGAGRPTLERSLPRLDPLDRGQPPCRSNPESESPTAIVMVCASGAVWVSLGGVFTLPPARLQIEQPASYTAVNACLGQRPDTLFVCFTSAHAEPDSSACQELVLRTVDMSVLSSAMPLLHTLVPLSAHLSALCLYLENTLDALAKEARARADGASRAYLLQTFEGVLRDHGVDEATTAEAELCRLAVTGRASESTSQFLLAKLKATKLNAWETAGRLGAVALIRLIYRHAQPAVERTILASTRLLEAVLAYDSDALPASDAGGACTAIVRAVVVLGWLSSRLNEYMDGLREEQRENQEFVDWALFAIDDLHWQNEGSRRLGDSHNTDGDDGLRPVRPDIDYKLLFCFIRKAFGGTADGAADASSDLQGILQGGDEDRTALPEVITAYFDVLAGDAHLDALSIVKQLTDAGDGDRPFEYVFHSQSLLDAAIARCKLDLSEDAGIGPPTCADAVREVKSLIAQALEWPSQVLGGGLQWNSQICAVPMGSGDGAAEILSEMHYVSLGDDRGCMYVASVTPSGEHLVLLAANSQGHQPEVSRVELALDVADSDERPRRVFIDVTSLSFFDDELLGVLFTVGGSDRLYLGTLEYQTIVRGTSDVAASRLEFAKLLQISDASAAVPAALASNGNEGRRCIAVVDKGGRYWWPFDMDNEEEGDENQSEESND
ncbi:hypothetical protein IWW55_000865 [Coemansia sp. RSA 2706]|nr:hypothetical protein IWW55_000865 [Coemansia sp. RSA 2706]KAJ2312553.1 hypothetical protein IWW54_002021 [Coemansia sp. RSA 2705]